MWTNQVTDGGLETWSSSTVLTNWTFGSVDGSLTRESTIVRAGTYSARIIGVTAIATIYQDQKDLGGHNIAYWRNRTVIGGAWVWCATASKARININDGGPANSPYHTGSSTWEYLQVIKTIDAAAANVYIQPIVAIGGTAYYDSVSFIDTSKRKLWSVPINIITKINGVAVANLTKINGITA